MVELSLPAGSLQGALQAFAGGADSVYLGLKQFSARKGAVNFTLKEVAQLKTEALRQNKKIYVAINTLLEDGEIQALLPTLKRLELLAIDALIVQDLGLAHLLRTHYPALPLHSSTQLAAHTVRGVKELVKLGFSRVVLSRELTHQAIKIIRDACPEVELKVFIHGALCYGFSGLCMASQILTGRSANRGECAQICRTYFHHAQGGQGYYFSMKDLFLAEKVTALASLGIDALKVEGRMKSPQYAYHASLYYRSLLDGKAIAPDDLLTQFSRTTTRGWVYPQGALVETRYPGHTGIEVGKIISSSGNSITLALSKEVAVRDGLLLFSNAKAEKFSLKTILTSTNKMAYKGEKGSIVTIKTPFKPLVNTGDPVFKISKHDGLLPLLKPEALQAYRCPVPLELTLSAESLRVATTHYFEDFPLTIEKAQTPQRLLENLEKLFIGGGGELFCGKTLRFKNLTLLKDEEIFIPLSALKAIRRAWYNSLDNSLKEEHYDTLAPKTTHLPPRESIVPPYDPLIPWVDTIEVARLLNAGQPIEDLVAQVDNHFFLPLSPVLLEEERYFSALEEILRYTGPKALIGLNNVAHLGWAREQVQYSYFADIYLYATNTLTVHLFSSVLKNFVGAYPWVEKERSKDFHLPLFISRACFRRDSLKGSCKGCSKRGEYLLDQNGKHYRILLRNCLTVVLEEPVKG